MKPNLEDMQVFLAVVEARTFTVAAERLARTKSAVSQAVSRLENDLGIRLLYRSTRALSLTEAGTQFYAHCRDIKASYDAALTDIKAAPSGALVVTAPHALCSAIVNPAIVQFTHANPSISVRLIADDSPIDLIQSQVDLAIRVGELELQSAKVSKLGILYESLYVSPDYLKAQGGLPNDLHAIASWTHIANEWQGIPVKYQLADGEQLSVNPKIRCNSLYDVLHLVEIGAGVARLPDIAVSQQVANGRLLKLFDVSAAPVHYMHLFSHKPPAKIPAFVKLLKKQF